MGAWICPESGSFQHASTSVGGFIRLSQSGILPVLLKHSVTLRGLSVPFDQNTQGVAINHDRRLSPLTEVNLKVAHLRFLDREAAHNEDSNGEEGSGSTERNSMDQKDVTENGLDGNGAATLMTQSATTPVFLGSTSVSMNSGRTYSQKANMNTGGWRAEAAMDDSPQE